MALEHVRMCPNVQGLSGLCKVDLVEVHRLQHRTAGGHDLALEERGLVGSADRGAQCRARIIDKLAGTVLAHWHVVLRVASHLLATGTDDNRARSCHGDTVRQLAPLLVDGSSHEAGGWCEKESEHGDAVRLI